MRRAAALIATVGLLTGCAGGGEPAPAKAETPPCCAKKKAKAKVKADAPTPSAGPAYVTKGPKPFADPAAVGVGKPVKDVAFTDIDGKPCTLEGLREGSKAVAVLFTSLGCPVTRKYAPTLREKLSPWRKKGVAVVFVNPSVAEELKDIKESRDRLKWTAFTVAQDPDYAWADALGAKRTADVFVIESSTGILRYRGPIDDRIGINYERTTARRHYLEDALAAVLAGRAVKEPALAAPGCVLGRIRLPKD